MIALPRTSSQTSLTASISQFVDQDEKMTLKPRDDLKRSLRFITSGRSDLFTNLDSIYSREERVSLLGSVITVALRNFNRPVITEVGLSNLIHFCHNDFPLPEDSVVAKSLLVCVFQIFDAYSVRRDGGMLPMFKVFIENKVNDLYPAFIKIITAGDIHVIRTFGVITTHVCKVNNLKTVKGVLCVDSKLNVDQIGCFKQGGGEFDALAFMSPRGNGDYTITIEGVPFSLPELHYKQLVAEAKLLLKLKQNDGQVNGLKMHGNSKYGFVRPNKPEYEKTTSHLVNVLDKCNKGMFIMLNVEGRAQLRYSIDKCLLAYIPNVGENMSRSCLIRYCINRIVAHRLLHYGGYGKKCEDDGCPVKGYDGYEAINLSKLQTNQPLSDLLESLRIANTATLEPEVPEPVVVTKATTEQHVVVPSTSLTTSSYSKTADPTKLNPYLKTSTVAVGSGGCGDEAAAALSLLMR